MSADSWPNRISVRLWRSARSPLRDDENAEGERSGRNAGALASKRRQEGLLQDGDTQEDELPERRVGSQGAERLQGNVGIQEGSRLAGGASQATAG